MIPVEEYTRVKKNTTLLAAMQGLTQQAEDENLPHPHRDLLVEDEEGMVIGKVTMLDIFKHMEPSYFKMDNTRYPNTLSKDFVQRVYRDFNLWSEPLTDICRRKTDTKVEEIMHTPQKVEIVDEEDSIDKALHAFVLGVHQPLLVQKDGNITGVLRLGDAFERVKKSILACEI